jgi:hypothetical protein
MTAEDPTSGVRPQDLLAHVATEIARRLPGQLPELLASDRFADGRGALDRLAVPGAAAAAAAPLGDAEARRLLDLLLTRWAAVAPVELAPPTAVAGPPPEEEPP